VKLSIIVPVYNEARTIGAIIEKVKQLPLEKEVIVVNDGSSDGTKEALQPYETEAGITVHHSRVNLGKGASVRLGFSYATGDIITIQDADLELDPIEYLKLIQPIVDGDADVVYGSRFKGLGLLQKKGNIAFFIANRALSGLASILFRHELTDIETCYKVFRRDVIPKLTLKAARFELEPELTAQILKKGFRLIELPIGYEPRTHADGKKISWRDGLQAVYTLIDQRTKP
jgi:dolichol-phosphate mannosyltransferase